MPILRALALPSLVLLPLLTACGGGGGGGGAAANLPRISLRDATFAAASETVELPVLLSSESGGRPPLLQFELQTDADRLDFTGNIVPAKEIPVAQAQRVAPGRIRVVLGDPLAIDGPAPLPLGALVSIEVVRAAGAVAGTPVEVRLIDLRASDAAGLMSELDPGTVTARITP